MATEKFQYLAGTLIPGTKYRVIRLLGVGGMGTVYEVEDTTIDKRYVLKTLHAGLANRKDLVERMQREAKALARLEHRNIVGVITADVTGDSLKLPYFVMQKLNGHTLRTVLDHKDKLEIDAAIRLSIDLLNALYHAHENRIIHRDVKPDNIFLHRDADGHTVPKLLDFGVMATTEAVTMTGQRFIGTLRYAAPEQLMGEKVCPQTDLYAAALVLYECLAGRGPFEEEGDAMKVARAHIEKPPPPLSTYREVPRSLERMVMQSLAKAPADRHVDAFTFAAELHRFLRELRGSLPPDQGAIKTASDVMQLPIAPPSAMSGAIRGLTPISSTPSVNGNAPSSGSAPTRPDAPVAGATLPASDLVTAPLRAIGAGATPAPAKSEPELVAESAPVRGATLKGEPPPMTLGAEALPLRAVVAREAVQREAAERDAAAVAKGRAAVDRNAVTGTLAAPLPARDGKTEMIDSMIGEGLAQAGTPPARIPRRESVPSVDDEGNGVDGGEATPRVSEPDAKPRAPGQETSASGSSSRTLSATPSAPVRSGPTPFTLAMSAVIAVSLAGAAALLYASRPTHSAPASAPAPAATASPSPAVSTSPVVTLPSSLATTAPAISAAPMPSASASAAPRTKSVEVERRRRESPVVPSGLERVKPASEPASEPARKLPGSGL